jgi:hypothetical protein
MGAAPTRSGPLMFGLFDWLKIGTGALAGAAVGFTLGYWQGHDAATVKAELERRGDDAKLQSMSDFDLCIAGLGGLPSASACNELRGLDEE